MNKNIGNCNHCGKTTKTGGEGQKTSWLIRWDIWETNQGKLGWAGTLCNKCMFKFQYGFLKDRLEREAKV